MAITVSTANPLTTNQKMDLVGEERVANANVYDTNGKIWTWSVENSGILRLGSDSVTTLGLGIGRDDGAGVEDATLRIYSDDSTGRVIVEDDREVRLGVDSNTIGNLIIRKDLDNGITAFTVGDTNAVIGHAANSVGSVTLDGNNAGDDNHLLWGGSYDAFVGRHGVASLNIHSSADMISDSAIVAQFDDSTATVNISDANSDWGIRESITIGLRGDVTFNITDTGNGGLSSTGGEVASTATASVDLNINGQGASWSASSFGNPSGSIYIAGSSSAAGGTAVVNLDDGGAIENADVFKVWDGGTVSLIADDTQVEANSIELDTGSLVNGIGDLNGDVTHNGGTLAPGNSPGEMDILGNYTMADDAILEMELGGLIAGTDYDVLNVTGNVSLDGTLNVLWWDGFTANAGDSFDLITAATILGEFDTVNLPDIGSLSWQFQILVDEIGSTDVFRLSVVTATVPIPAAFWLFGSALGFIGFMRRRIS